MPELAVGLNQLRVIDAAWRKAVDNSNSHDDLPTPRDLGRSPTGFLRIRCPECHAPTEIPVEASESAWAHISCRSCGMEFRLVDEFPPDEPELQRIGHFELLVKVGAGGFGTVWKGLRSRSRSTRGDQAASARQNGFART
jgi:ribosomal protein S27E